MTSAWIKRLERFTSLSADDKRILDELMYAPKRLEAGEDIVKEGDAPSDVHLIVKGIACSYKLLADGGRQITACLLPGDLCDIHMLILKKMDHSIATLRRSEVAYIPHEKMLDVVDRNPRIARALWWSTLQDDAILREWLTNNGRRDAYASVAHLLYEMFLRLRAVGLTKGDTCELPLTQHQLADILSLTPIHVNRVLQRLRADNLIALARTALTIVDPKALKAAAQFDVNYLHLK